MNDIHHKGDLRREELRGIFAIGVIAAIFTADQLYGKVEIFGATIEQLTGYLLFFWFLYILFMAVGVSDDIFGSKTSELSRTLGRLFFMAGAGGSVVILITAPLFYFRDHGMTLQFQIGLLLMAALMVYLTVRLVRESRKKSKATR